MQGERGRAHARGAWEGVPAFVLLFEVRAGHAEHNGGWQSPYNFASHRSARRDRLELRNEAQTPADAGFGLHVEVRAGHAQPSVQVPQV